jgi:uncharacterized protein (TIGR03067 family)
MKCLPDAALAGCALVFINVVSTLAADADQQKLQGKWAVESFDYNGMPVEVMKAAVREFKDDTYTITPKSGDAINGVVKMLDSTKKPKTIDLEVNGRTLKGIYEIEGDTLKLCYNLTNPERPTELASKPDSGVVLVVHKRAK